MGKFVVVWQHEGCREKNFVEKEVEGIPCRVVVVVVGVVVVVVGVVGENFVQQFVSRS